MDLTEALREVDTITDALGLPIDKNIRRVIAALRMHEFPTRASCEGHVNWGSPYPWIDMGTDVNQSEPDPEISDTSIQKIGKSLQKVAREYQNVELYTTVALTNQDRRYHITATKEELEYRSLEDNVDELRTKKINQKDKKRLIKLLDNFYRQNPQLLYSRVLTLNDSGAFGEYTLQNIGAITNELVDDKQKEENIKLFREEMNSFAQYLINLKK